jgi:hypothetical protein
LKAVERDHGRKSAHAGSKKPGKTRRLSAGPLVRNRGFVAFEEIE